MPKLTNYQIREAVSAANKLAEMPLELDLAIKVRKLLLELREHLRRLESRRQTLVLSHAALDKDGEPKKRVSKSGEMTFELEDTDKFNLEYTKLMEETVIIDITISTSELRPEGKIKPSILYGLGPIILIE